MMRKNKMLYFAKSSWHTDFFKDDFTFAWNGAIIFILLIITEVFVISFLLQ